VIIDLAEAEAQQLTVAEPAFLSSSEKKVTMQAETAIAEPDAMSADGQLRAAEEGKEKELSE
jgi:hypothetical protein